MYFYLSNSFSNKINSSITSLAERLISVASLLSIHPSIRGWSYALITSVLVVNHPRWPIKPPPSTN